MRIKSALATLAGGVLLLAALACETDAPPTVAPVPAATTAPIAAAPTPSPPPVPTATPSPIPTATPLPEGVGICYRTPEVQEWIIQQLQIPACRLITEPELYRITAEMPISLHRIKPGDLAGLVNVSAAADDSGHCGDWENPEYAAAILDGLNSNAAIKIWTAVAFDRDDWPRSQVISYGIYGTVDYPAAVRQQFDDPNVLLEAGIGDDAQIESLLRRGEGLKHQWNTLALNIAAAVATAQGKEQPVIRITPVGRAVVGEPQMPGSVEVIVEDVRPNEIPECRGE